MLKTAFWIRAVNSLPVNIRARYMVHFERAERWELALDSIVEFFSRVKSVRFDTPKGA